jgi:GAF domain-containing protein
MSSERDARALDYVEALRQIEAAQESYSVEQALAAAREQLSMDAAYVTTIDAGQQRIDAIVGDVGVLGLVSGAVFPLEQTYCVRMLNGEIPNVVPDTRLEPAVRHLAVTREIGAYIGVPVKLSDGRIHGSLCCACHERRTELGGKELRFMQVLADIVATRVEQAQGDLAGRAGRLRGRQRCD